MSKNEKKDKKQKKKKQEHPTQKAEATGPVQNADQEEDLDKLVEYIEGDKEKDTKTAKAKAMAKNRVRRKQKKDRICDTLTVAARSPINVSGQAQGEARPKSCDEEPQAGINEDLDDTGDLNPQQDPPQDNTAGSAGVTETKRQEGTLGHLEVAKSSALKADSVPKYRPPHKRNCDENARKAVTRDTKSYQTAAELELAAENDELEKKNIDRDSQIQELKDKIKILENSDEITDEEFNYMRLLRCHKNVTTKALREVFEKLWNCENSSQFQWKWNSDSVRKFEEKERNEFEMYVKDKPDKEKRALEQKREVNNIKCRGDRLRPTNQSKQWDSGNWDISQLAHAIIYSHLFDGRFSGNYAPVKKHVKNLQYLRNDFSHNYEVNDAEFKISFDKIRDNIEGLSSVTDMDYLETLENYRTWEQPVSAEDHRKLKFEHKEIMYVTQMERMVCEERIHNLYEKIEFEGKINGLEKQLLNNEQKWKDNEKEILQKKEKEFLLIVSEIKTLELENKNLKEENKKYEDAIRKAEAHIQEYNGRLRKSEETHSDLAKSVLNLLDREDRRGNESEELKKKLHESELKLKQYEQIFDLVSGEIFPLVVEKTKKKSSTQGQLSDNVESNDCVLSAASMLIQVRQSPGTNTFPEEQTAAASSECNITQKITTTNRRDKKGEDIESFSNVLECIPVSENPENLEAQRNVSDIENTHTRMTNVNLHYQP